ncbi:tRNA (5-methylaminomethyl-2-thiouridine)(34)-methyltransferase MnmD [Phenylobacterium sp.]|uniref:tRNA (5-methylaminomethyl-2-thiouridine)(34)-methyltransferase MnmD n=1 Tax=Phenylobacterium sp. TaxID=1871053 RepID=UPI002733810A|nr:tRNA (5-methylaminomethyl-2-thiouridine)(34)-methyltransferase MnmD [Phenylobacterium sp.]MDP3855683.1 tRNA (5-methylaminomethyl-2-thiouridine)(34)-methyltransferase MnmD [Phenylobacterium sp.]
MSAQSPLVWTDDGLPRSRLYGDVYFSSQDGLAESRAVFLQGCGLPQAWSGRTRFTVAELGFGTGLNILALLDLWRGAAPAGGHLHIFSVEAHPITAGEAARALAAWPELADIAQVLTHAWPGQARGFHRVDLPAFNATLDLAVMEAEPALRAWSGQADAWFLDGFSPALNPQMWREELLALVAQRSAPGARAATFTVAGAVRRGLQAAGFAIDKRPGHGRKRERLEARLPGEMQEATPARQVAVIGAGIAGASAARALRMFGCEPLLIEADGLGAGASGNPSALVTPRLDAGLGPVAELAAQAFGRATALFATIPAAVIARGVLQLAAGERDPDRFATIAGSDLFEPGAVGVLSANQTLERLGEPAPIALDLATALVVEPAIALDAWAGPVLRASVARLEAREDGWALLDAAGDLVAQVQAVILAAGQASVDLRPDLPLRPVRGQASWTDGVAGAPAAAWGGYVLPTRAGLLFGATHDRDDTSLEVRAADHARNLASLSDALPGLAARITRAPLQGRAAVRATTPDRLPLAGPVAGAPGLFALTGFGSRGFSLAPLLAEHVAALALDAPSPLPAHLAALVDPDRFRARAAKRGRNSVSEPAQP